MGTGMELVEVQRDASERRVYLDHNATTPLAPEVAQAVRDAMCQAWGNPSSSHPTGRKAKELIGSARESLARMVGGRLEDIVFTSGGTEANNMVIHTARRHFHESHGRPGDSWGMPHIVTSSVEHDSIRLPLEQLVKESLAEATFVAVSPRSGRAEVDDILAAIRPTTCLVSIMLANNETGVIMPVAEVSQCVRALNQRRAVEGLPRILVHTDAAQMVGKGRVDVRELRVDYLTIVGHKFYGPRIGALYVRGPGTTTPLHPMFFGGGQERSFRPGTENTPMIAGLGQAAELVSKNWEAYEAHMRDVRDYLEARLEALLDSAQLWDPLQCGTECLAAERGARHHPGRRGPGCAGPCAGCGAAGAGPSPVDPRNCSPAITQVLSGQSSCCRLHVVLKGNCVVGAAVTIPATEEMCLPCVAWAIALIADTGHKCHTD
ncbi:selenocysteine lyase isoform X1 [Phalacrocorax aristotelis]|uniref:selenocysteine lyase isoform X1 n=2 Tax=Phalacrocorax aristotelis TaxID=126867 RepID=UPI003F4B3A09